VRRPDFGAPAIDLVERPRQQERHFLLAETAMRAQAVSRQLAQIVILPPRADICRVIATLAQGQNRLRISFSSQ
jgi:hypothetical protein